MVICRLFYSKKKLRRPSPQKHSKTKKKIGNKESFFDAQRDHRSMSLSHVSKRKISTDAAAYCTMEEFRQMIELNNTSKEEKKYQESHLEVPTRTNGGISSLENNGVVEMKWLNKKL